MKNLLVLVFCTCTFRLTADIPRVDIIQLSISGEIYYTIAETDGFEFKEGQVFDYEGKLFCDADDYFKKVNAPTQHSLELYPEVQLIPFSKIYSKDSGEYKSNPQGHFFTLKGQKKRLKYSEFEDILFLKRIVGTSMGWIYSKLSETDMIWINDYPLEVVSSFSDNENCILQVVCIKGNISKKEAQEIKVRFRAMYKKRDEDWENFQMGSITNYVDELLKSHIFLVAHCSC